MIGNTVLNENTRLLISGTVVGILYNILKSERCVLCLKYCGLTTFLQNMKEIVYFAVNRDNN